MLSGLGLGLGLLLVIGYEVAVTGTAGTDQGCPSPRQVTDALSARLPGMVSPAGEPPAPGQLRLVVAGGTAEAPGALRIDLVDDAGKPRLRRVLPADTQPTDCPALAETVALIVDRYLREVGDEAPAATSAEPVANAVTTTTASPSARAAAETGVSVLAGAGWRAASTAGGEPEAMVGVDVDGTVGGQRVGMSLTGGVTPSRMATWTGGHATLRRLPLRLGTFVSLAAGPGRFEPGLGFGLDLLLLDVGGTELAGSLRRVSPSVDLALGYRVRLGWRLFARGVLAAALAVPYQFVPAEGAEPLHRTPRTYLKIGIELGVSFR